MPSIVSTELGVVGQEVGNVPSETKYHAYKSYVLSYPQAFIWVSSSPGYFLPYIGLGQLQVTEFQHKLTLIKTGG